MKKLMTLLAISALAASSYGMGKSPDKTGCCPTDAAVKEACCTQDGACKTEGACKKEGECKTEGACKKAKDAAGTCTKSAEKAAAECSGGTCPLPK